jgi:hypothetical protein
MPSEKKATALAEVRTDDSVTVRDYSAWVKMQKLKH